jgi:hypothetical protein
MGHATHAVKGFDCGSDLRNPAYKFRGAGVGGLSHTPLPPGVELELARAVLLRALAQFFRGSADSATYESTVSWVGWWMCAAPAGAVDPGVGALDPSTRPGNSRGSSGHARFLRQICVVASAPNA